MRNFSSCYVGLRFLVAGRTSFQLFGTPLPANVWKFIFSSMDLVLLLMWNFSSCCAKLLFLLVPDTAPYIRGWIQMVLTPNDLFSWNNKYNKYNEYNVTNTFTCFFLAMHTNLLCACWHLEAMKGSSSLTSCRLLILSRLLSSLIWAKLMLLVPALGIRSPPP